MAERRSTRSNAARLRPLLPLAAIWFVGLLLLSALVVQREVPYDQLLLDPNSINNAPWYTGLVSNLGILGWTTATASAQDDSAMKTKHAIYQATFPCVGPTAKND